jgi:chloride channel protein, CIC family
MPSGLPDASSSSGPVDEAGVLHRRWRRLVASAGALDWDEGVLLLVAGALIGIVGGLAVVGFYGLIDLAYIGFVSWPRRLIGPFGAALYLPALTGLGVWAAWFIVKRTHTPDGQNVADVQLDVAKRHGVVKSRPVAVRTLVSAITLGSGGSAGSEGPVAVLGAAVGSAFGRVLRLQPRHVKILVGCGAAAGIAGAFNAPFAGAFFALEEVLGSFSVAAFSPVVIASVVGALTAHSVLGTHPAFHMPAVVDVHPVENALLYPLLGVACGLVSALYAWLTVRMPYWSVRLGGPDWLRPVAGGVLVGAITAASGGLLSGTGHLSIPTAVFGGMVWYALIGLALAKVVATALTLGTGGSGGVFTPSLFIGAALGGGFGRLLAGLVPGHFIHAEAWALVGMGGVVAGATRAPLTAIFMVYELTNDSNYVVPLMIVAVISLVTAKRFSRYGLYDGWLIERGEQVSHGIDEALMHRLHVADALDPDGAHVRPDESVTALSLAAGRTPQDAVAVVEEDGTLVGLVSRRALRTALEQTSAGTVLVAEDLAEPIAPLAPEASLADALRALNASALDALPVAELDSNTGVLRFVGLVGRADILALYERELEHLI